MKQLLTLAFAIGSAFLLQAQNVGIGTTTPNSSAALEIKSTTKGLLIPSMTTSQRFAINNPPPGLMVYDTDKDEFYHYNGTGWTVIVNGSYWSRPITSRSRIANATDSVGIGTNSPTERLDVNGNIRSRDNISATNNIDAGGTLSGTTLVNSGNAVIGGTTLLNGDATTNGDLIMNSGGTVQFKTSSVNKTFVQLSGDNLRMGTNSGNSAGDFIIRMNGNDRVNVNAQGDLNVDGKITRTATGAANLVPYCFGRVELDGTVVNAGSGNWTVAKVGTGQYEITCTGILSTDVVIATSRDFRIVMGAYHPNAGKVKFYTYSVVSQSYDDEAFSFLIYK
ncbi:hypothetical protein [Ferruginibacter sp.]